MCLELLCRRHGVVLANDTLEDKEHMRTRISSLETEHTLSAVPAEDCGIICENLAKNVKSTKHLDRGETNATMENMGEWTCYAYRLCLDWRLL